jgi:peptide-methionine (S)-S-oxide reductase
MEKPFDRMEGVLSTTSGYAGGSVDNPSYEQVSAGDTGHIEVVEVRYDPAKVSYAQLLNTYWRNVDPLAVNRQFCDAGPQYRSAIFALDEEQRALAEASRAELSKRFGREVATEVLPAARFWPAEDYHQDYYLKNPIRYSYYRSRCGRDARLEALWGK